MQTARGPGVPRLLGKVEALAYVALAQPVSPKHALLPDDGVFQRLGNVEVDQGLVLVLGAGIGEIAVVFAVELGRRLMSLSTGRRDSFRGLKAAAGA